MKAKNVEIQFDYQCPNKPSDTLHRFKTSAGYLDCRTLPSMFGDVADGFVLTVWVDCVHCGNSHNIEVVRES